VTIFSRSTATYWLPPLSGPACAGSGGHGFRSVCNGEEIGDKECFNVLRWKDHNFCPSAMFAAVLCFPWTAQERLSDKPCRGGGWGALHDHWGPEDIGFCWQVQKQGFSIFVMAASSASISCRETHKNMITDDFRLA
jgi:hypothetical protein